MSSERRYSDTNVKIRRTIKRACLIFFIMVIALFFMFPFLILLSRSLMTDEQAMQPSILFPTKFTLVNFKNALDPSMLKYIKNTLIVAVCNCLFIPFSSALCGYGFAKMKFKGKNFWFFLALCTSMIPTIVTQIPLYVMYSKMHWLGTFLPLIIPGLFGGGALNVFLMRQYMRGIPDSVVEAAKIDGANWFTIFIKFIIPLARPVIVLVMVQTFFAVWNDFTSPLIYLNGKEELFTLSVGIYSTFITDTGGDFLPNLRMAVGVMMMLPEIVLFFIFQKELVEGVAFTGQK